MFTFPWVCKAQLVGLVVALASGSSNVRFVRADAAMDIAAFRQHMIDFGAQHCDTLRQYIYNDGGHLNAVYYDGERVYFQIADFLGDSSWISCAQAAEWVYRDNYMHSPGGPAGYWNFARGLAMDYERTGDPASLAAVEYLANEANWCRGSAYDIDNLPGNDLSRECAFCVLTFIEARRFAMDTPRLDLYLGFAKGHVQQWLTHASAMQPFMAALTAEALATYYDQVHADPDIPDLVGQLAHELWTHWDPASRSFLYDNHDGTFTPAPDLNLLIAPTFSWAYARSGDPWYADHFDSAFGGGVAGAFLGGDGKQFNQNYRWSIQGLKWRYPGFADVPRVGMRVAGSVDVWPLPVRSGATIRWTMSRPGRARLTVYDTNGRTVRRIFDGECRDRPSASWDGLDATGHRVAPGVYFVGIDTDPSVARKKIVVIH